MLATVDLETIDPVLMYGLRYGAIKKSKTWKIQERRKMDVNIHDQDR